MRLLWLPGKLRAAGLPVVEVPGWKTLGSDDWNPSGAIFHATADKARTGDGDRLDDPGAIAVIRNGRPGLAGPIATAYVNRAGVWYVIASGRCNTVKVGWSGPLNGWGNTRVLGVEAENDNRGEPWPAVQLDSLRRGFAVILAQLDIPVSRLAGHYEHQPKDKTDPFGINMISFRRDVARVLDGEEQELNPIQDERLRDAHYVLAKAVPNPTGAPGRVPLHVWAAWMTGAVKALATAVSNVDEATKAQLAADLGELKGMVDAVPEEILGDELAPEQDIALRLRAHFGDEKAQAIGVILATGVEPVPVS